MTDCIRFAPMIGSREGELTPSEAEALAQHLLTCKSCQALSADLSATDGLVAEGLMRAANSRDFSTFADEVMEKAGVRDDAAAPVRARGGLLAWFRHHRAATAAGLVPVLAALAAIVYLRLEGGPVTVAMLEFTSEGEATTLIQTADGPVVLLTEDEGT